jgi:heme-degrading monooxygenase HmoA
MEDLLAGNLYRDALEALLARLRDNSRRRKIMIVKSIRRGALVLASVGFVGLALAADIAHSTHPIARMWRGHVRASQADVYQKYLDEAGVRKIKKIAGNIGVQMFRRDEGETTEFVVISYWKTAADIKNFTGPNWEKVHALPDDPKYLVPPEATVTHYEVIGDK